MSSLHLSKILPSRRSNAGVEQDNYEKYQQISINKALNPMEAPLKVKHARAAIISTYRTRESQSFWVVATQQPLMENQFTAWKFCHLLHKVLREGHASILVQSQRHKKLMIEVGKMWGLLKDGVGVCIQTYTKLLVAKLEFHDKNPTFPGNLQVDFNELERVAQNDINYYFQLGVEIFDYLDDILALQSKVFATINTFRMTSMTPQGQCRLAPLIPLIQDSNPLYDISVRLMFKLHAHLPNDILSGHRERFRAIFNQLKAFYDNVRPLQYFADLIQVPQLPANAPNFSSKVDFGSYVPPVVVVPEPEPEPVVDNLVDMSFDAPAPITPPESEPSQPDFDRIIQNRDELIHGLQLEIERLQKCIKSMTISHRDNLNQLEEQISRLNLQLGAAHEEVTHMRLLKDELELKAQTAPTLELKAIAVEERAKASEEKFQKLKSMYTQIRDEHVKLLRQHGETAKELSASKKETTELVTKTELLQVQLEEFQQKESEGKVVAEQTAEAQRREQHIQQKYDDVFKSYEQLQLRYDDLQADKSAEIAELKTKARMLEVQMEQSKEEVGQSLVAVRDELDAKALECSELQEKCLLVEKDKQAEVEQLKAVIEENRKQFEATNAILSRLSDEKLSVENDIQDLLDQQAEIEERFSSALQTISALETTLQDTQISSESALRSLLEATIKASEKLALRAMAENEFTHGAGTSSHFMMLAEELQDALKELSIVFETYRADNASVEGLARKSVLNGHLLAAVQIQGMTVCSTAADIEAGERIADEIKAFGTEVTALFESLKKLSASEDVTPKINSVRTKLTAVTTMVHELSKNSDNSGQLGDLVESELAGMDKAIEEAASRIAEMLSHSRAQDSGVKLEVNERILDACTSLMQAIRVLVQKSKVLQAEIVALGRGSATEKEFYKRNHQWTEGLISSAKSVATGANLLVAAANKAVSGEAKHHLDIIVAAQEIAACTAQLVVASRVKAPRGSPNLAQLSTASRNVTQATGALVATAKDCSQQLEDSQELDLTKLTVHQAKTLEMEIQVKVLELEQKLEMERLRLAAFRRNNYQNSGEKITN